MQDKEMPTERDTEAQAGLQDARGQTQLDKLLNKVVHDRSRYIGVYAPGKCDFNLDTFRLAVPDFTKRPGRGFRGAREEVLLETSDRQVVERALTAVQGLAGTDRGLMAVRHITNPKQGKDEGLRLVWFDESGVGEAEMADWPRRDKMKREGKTVYAKEDEWVGGWTRFDVGHAAGQAHSLCGSGR
ncbi:hypothetical protein JCM24511_09156 [Saitozyma sp. JCM 24511]|nr:hypothetical protein JCM24511_09156 [Saitozyma sp. JCM 24511]